MNTARTEIYWSTFTHPLFHDRPLQVAATVRGICMISLPNDTHMSLKQWASKKFLNSILMEDKQRLSLYMEQLHAYCERSSTAFKLPLDLQGTSFQVSVWQAVMKIPYGQIRSYLDIAKLLNKPHAIRAVGSANGANPIPIIVPCHRVIGKNGALTGYSGGLKLKETLLRLEGYNDFAATGHDRYNF